MLMVSHGTIGVRVGRDARIFSSNYTKHGISCWVPPWICLVRSCMSSQPSFIFLSSEDSQKHSFMSGALKDTPTTFWHCSLKWWKALTRMHLSLLVYWLTYPTLLPKIHFAWFSVPSQIFTSDSFPVYQHPRAVLLLYLFLHTKITNFFKIFLL